MMLVMSWMSVAAAATTCLEGATLHTPEGPRQETLVLEDERILSLGSDCPEGSVRLDLQDRVISAGLIALGTNLGLIEVGLEDGTHSGGAGRGDEVRAAFQVAEGYNPRSSLIPITRYEGVTSAWIQPEGGLIAGQGAGVDLLSSSQEQAVFSPQVGVVASFGGKSRGGQIQALRRALTEAERYSRQAWERAPEQFDHRPEDLEALQQVTAGAQPVMVSAHRASDIEALLRLQRDFELSMILMGAAEAWLLAEELAEAEVSVVLDPLLYGPGSFDQLYARPDNARLLLDAGVSVSFAGGRDHNTRKLRQLAGNAVRAGVSHQEALRAITQSPAEALGWEERGQLAPGSLANLVVWTGDPLELDSWAEQVWIRGEQQDLSTRQTLLRDRYRTLPATPDVLSK